MDKIKFKGLVEEINEKDATLSVAVATDTSIDRDGEIVDPAGIDLTNFEKNPVLLWAHDYRSLPIGKVIAIKRDGSRLLFTPKFAVDENPQAKQIFDLFKNGFLSAFSIGFIPKEHMDRDNSDGSRTRVFMKSELLEISAVPVPANPNALVSIRSYKSADGKAIDKEVLEAIEDGTKSLETKETPANNGELEALRKDLDSVKASITVLEGKVADNGEKTQEVKAPAISELVRSPEFQRGVLQAVDKGIGKVLRDLNKA